MKVEVDSPTEVSKDFLDFVQFVSDGEKLHDWELIIWSLKGEAECITDMRLLYIPFVDDIEKMEVWFLHEVAHATFEIGGGSRDDSIWHRELWKVEFDRLLGSYMPNINQKTILWLRKLE